MLALHELGNPQDPLHLKIGYMHDGGIKSLVKPLSASTILHMPSPKYLHNIDPNREKTEHDLFVEMQETR